MHYSQPKTNVEQISPTLTIALGRNKAPPIGPLVRRQVPFITSPGKLRWSWFNYYFTGWTIVSKSTFTCFVVGACSDLIGRKTCLRYIDTTITWEKFQGFIGTNGCTWSEVLRKKQMVCDRRLVVFDDTRWPWSRTRHSWAAETLMGCCVSF